MKLLIKIQIRPKMDSETSSDSGNLSPPHPLSKTVETLMPLVYSLQKDMDQIKEKISTDLAFWTEIPVSPKTTELQELWVRYRLADDATIQCFLSALFLKAKKLDAVTRTIHFSKEDAATLKQPSMTIYKMLHLLVDSVNFLD